MISPNELELDDTVAARRRDRDRRAYEAPSPRAVLRAAAATIGRGVVDGLRPTTTRTMFRELFRGL